MLTYAACRARPVTKRWREQSHTLTLHKVRGTKARASKARLPHKNIYQPESMKLHRPPAGKQKQLSTYDLLHLRSTDQKKA